MRYDQIVIKTKEQLKQSKSEVRSALEVEVSIGTKEKKYALMYKYLGSSKPSKELGMNESDAIGYVTDIRRSDNGDIVGTVCINDFMKKSEHFQGIIDNIVVGYLPPNKNKRCYPTIQMFVIYDKYAKAIIDEKNKAKAHSQSVTKVCASPIEDDIANDKNVNPLMQPGVMDEIRKEAEEIVNREQ